MRYKTVHLGWKGRKTTGSLPHWRKPGATARRYGYKGDPALLDACYLEAWDRAQAIVFRGGAA